MKCRPLSRALVLFLAAVLSCSPAFALDGRTARGERGPDLFASVWRLLGSLLSVVEKGRSTIDPDGAAAPAPNSEESTSDDDSEGRWTIDPNG
ncbi:MAG TPA: hypothetical protein VE685_01900 [Thermoanaerobaculia bacterium]|nr:hypothetical protein [Thermoanaerobaculia bacterium]